ncbi:MAG: RNB domain-containing ribonuclease, partial [Blastocatellia bacterium]
EEKPIAFLMLRTMQKARYDPSNLGHFGLAAESYTHFTSPIRRYPDLIVHRVLREVIRRPKAHPIAPGELERIAGESSERERAADAAERELDEWRKAKFMNERLGEEFDGMITNVREFGFYVELNDFFIEGLVPVATLHDDYYELDEGRHALVGSAGNRTFKLGDRVRVRVDRVNVDRHLVDFSVVSAAPHRSKKRSR